MKALLILGMKWEAINGEKVSFWKDYWIGNMDSISNHFILVWRRCMNFYTRPPNDGLAIVKPDLSHTTHIKIIYIPLFHLNDVYMMTSHLHKIG